MQEVSIKKSHLDIQHQYYFLKGIENSIYFKSHRTAIIIVASLTVAYIGLMLVTGSNAFITLKAVSSVLIAIIWIVSFTYFIWIGYRFVKRNSSIEQLIQTKLNEDRDYVMSFDEEHFRIRSKDFKLELDWSYFKAYLESERAVFLFPEGSLYNAYSFTGNEIGEENLENLRRIVKRKLTLLEVE